MTKRGVSDVETELLGAEAELRALREAREPLTREFESFARVGRLRAELATLASGHVEEPARITDAAAEFIRVSEALDAPDAERGAAAEAELLGERLDALRAQLSPDDWKWVKTQRRRMKR